MANRSGLSSQILGQILLMQSVVTQLPDKTAMCRFVCRGLKDVSGVERVEYRLLDSDAEPFEAFAGPTDRLQVFPIVHKGRRYAVLLIHLTDPAAFSPYVAFIKNFSNMLGVIFEERKNTEKALRSAHERFLTVLNSIDATIYVAERLGYRVTSRVGSLEAIEAFEADANGYDLVITDMTMPNISGDALAKRLLDIRRDIPIIICTGFSERIDEEKAAAIGIRAFLMKPVVVSDMARVIRKLLDEQP